MLAMLINMSHSRRNKLHHDNKVNMHFTTRINDMLVKKLFSESPKGASRVQDMCDVMFVA